MDRIVKIALALGVILLVVLLSLIGYVQLNDSVQSAGLLRQVEPRLLLAANHSVVTFTRLGQPAVNCPPARRATTIVLLLDKSGSMADNAALSAALTAAQLFIETVDLTAAHVAIVFFDELPTRDQPLTQDQTALQAVLAAAEEPRGSTDIAGALHEAGEILRTAQTRATTVPMIILLTDGGSNPQAARQIGQQLKDEGVRLVTISLLTSDSNPELLRTLASSPADYHETPAPAELRNIYANLAQELNTAVAFNVAVTETVKAGLNVIPGSLEPPGFQVGNQIVWELPVLSNNEAAFTYQIAPSRWGLHKVNAEPTTMSYTDCLAGAVVATLAAGPSLFVLPPAWFLAALVLLPFLPFVLMAWIRRPKPHPLNHVEPPRSAEPEPPPDPYPAWLKRLDDGRKTLASSELVTEASELTPTMIIGLGPVGRLVLSQLAQTLRARYGGHLPEMIHLLQIDVQPKDVPELNLSRPDYLEPEEWVLLEPDLAQVSRNLQRSPRDWPHLAWYEATAVENYGRAHGRMALFYDLKDGATPSVLWRSLTRTAAKLEHLRLRLVGSTFDDVSSGMLVDVAWLMQMITNSNVDVELWLSGPLNQAWSFRLHNPRQLLPINEQKDRTLATLRELERFQRNAIVPFHYVFASNVQTQFRQTATAALVQTLFLFTPPDEKSGVDDHLATIADSLLAVLHTPAQQALSQHLSRTAARANILTNNECQGMVCSLGAYSVRMPLGLLEEALAWRMVQELLFEEQVGLLPLLRLSADGAYEAVDVDSVPDNAVKRRESAEAFVQQYRRRWQTPDFYYAVARHANDLLNGEGEGAEPSLRRSGGLVKATRWLESVRNQLNIEGEAPAAQSVNGLRQQLDGWQTFLVEGVMPQVQQRWQDARATLAQLTSQKGRHWVLPPGLEWPIYRQRIRSWLDAPAQMTTSEPLLRAAQRFGWYLAYDEAIREWQVQLWRPPGDFIWAGPDSLGGIDSFVLDRNASGFATALYQLVMPLARHRSSTQYALDGAEQLDRQQWLAQAAPRLTIDSLVASRLMGGSVSELAVLVAPKSVRSARLQETLRVAPGAPAVELCETNDETSVTLLRVRDRVPLQAYELGYGAEAWQNQFVSPGLYVWRGEQLAASMESGGHLSARFVGWLEQDAQMVDLFARAFLFSLLEQVGQDELELPGLGSWPGTSIGVGLANLFSRDDNQRPAVFFNPERRTRALQELSRAIDQAQEAIWRDPGKRSYLRQAEEKLIAPLVGSSDSREQELALYLQGVLQRL